MNTFFSEDNKFLFKNEFNDKNDQLILQNLLSLIATFVLTK